MPGAHVPNRASLDVLSHKTPGAACASSRSSSNCERQRGIERSILPQGEVTGRPPERLAWSPIGPISPAVR
ncbi:hypothetical protein GCM10011504_15450 [Siccirubricoccus deserti]|nr:hypothetical protein GCM10011504_15450 [Siccirubricoccus deserti]